jgi:hypothetical protein
MYHVYMTNERDRRFNMLLSEAEDRMLRALAEDAGLTVSDYLRQFIRRAFLERWPTNAKRR